MDSDPEPDVVVVDSDPEPEGRSKDVHAREDEGLDNMDVAGASADEVNGGSDHDLDGDVIMVDD